MGRLLATAGSRLRLNSHPGTLFLTLTLRLINTLIGRYSLYRNWNNQDLGTSVPLESIRLD